MLSSNEFALSEAPSSAASAAIRSLNADFVRKGIVVSGADGKVHELDPTVRRLVDSLKRSCKTTGSRELGDITSAIQLWKERSLHHTLQTLDQAKKDAAGNDWKVVGSSRHIQAIELHEKAGREVKDAVLRVLQNVVDAIVLQINGFTSELAAVIHALVKPEIEEELSREKAMTERLVAEKQQCIRDQFALQDAHAALVKRLDEWERADDGGGDAILCRKLRDQVKQLKAQHAEMETAMLDMAHQNEQWRYEMVAMKAELETVYKTLAMTRAMQDVLHCRDEQFERVRLATSTAKNAATARADGTSLPPTIMAYDARSGRSICYQSPTRSPSVKASPSKPTRTVLASMPPQPQTQRWKSAEPARTPRSPNQQRVAAASRSTVTANRQDEVRQFLLDRPSLRVSRPFSSPRPPTR